MHAKAKIISICHAHFVGEYFVDVLFILHVQTALFQRTGLVACSDHELTTDGLLCFYQYSITGCLCSEVYTRLVSFLLSHQHAAVQLDGLRTFVSVL